MEDRGISRATNSGPSQQEGAQQEDDQLLVIPSLRAAYFYPLGLLLVSLTTSWYHDRPRLLWAVTGIIFTGLLLRALLAFRKSMYRSSPRLWRLLFRLTMPLSSGPVGVLTAFAIWHYDGNQWALAAMMLFLAATGVATVVTYFPNRPLAYLQLFPAFVPIILVLLWLGQPKTVALSVGVIFFLGFLLAHLRWLHAGFGRQMTERSLEVERLGELESAKRAADAANEAKNRFLANVSHEIRTPMHSVLGMTELVLNTAVTSEQREYLFALRGSASSLLEIVNDLLDLSKIEAEKIRLEPEVFDIRSTIEDVRMTLALQSEAKHIRLETSVDPDVPLAIEGDPLRLRQVLVNLGGNAIKGTDSGFARIRVQLQEGSREKVCLYFSVEDSGAGIRGEHGGNAFQTFSQSAEPVAEGLSGAGLGLSIASQLVKLMGSEIGIERRPGLGSLFSFRCTFPVGEFVEPPLPAKPAANHSANPLHILLAEDNAVNQLLAVRLLKAQGHSVVVAGTGAEAVHEVSTRDFDLVLMDNQMPELSGIEATIRIREMGYTLPIVALSASAMAGDRERFLAAGMDGCLAKPFHAEDLYAEIERVLPAGRRADAAVRQWTGTLRNTAL